ncbi:MAG: radical SAM protein [Candidatus Asgardarchaeum californiense]|nr:MAG: radical SAM protein [Candidatus Asgardarchaeum californiense]
MNSIYGPVASWRLGRSLGVDLICSEEKICSFNCLYCQLEKTKKISKQRELFVSVNRLIKELSVALKKTTSDVITLSGTGEPTLAKNLDEVIQMIRELSKLPIAILTNSTLLNDKFVRDSLSKIDIIIAKLDAPNQEIFQTVNRPLKEISFQQTINGIKKMKEEFTGKFALQMMFIKENKDYASDLAELAREINPDEVQINTPLRPCPVQPLSKTELERIEKEFTGLNTLSVYNSTKPKTDPLDKLEIFKRRRLVR